MINCRNFLQPTARLQEESTVQRDIFARRLRGFSEKAELSQAEISRRLKLGPPVVGNWFQARNLPESSILPALAAVLGCSIDDLFSANSPPLEPVADESKVSALAEDQAPYLTTSPEVSSLSGKIRAKFDSLLSAAADNRDRLGWLIVQLDQMQLYASAWLSNEEVNRRAVERSKKITAEARAARALLNDADDARRRREAS